jgi:hypothetical protein
MIKESDKQTPIVIDYKEISRAIRIFSQYTNGFYDPKRRVYVLDGFEVTEKFINDTLSKVSHYMNAVSNMRMRIQTGSVDDYTNAKIDTQKSTGDSTKKYLLVETQAEIPQTFDASNMSGGNEVITYG